MEGEKAIKDPQESKGFGSGMVVGIVVGIGLFLLTVQLLYIAK
jgi:hypothetical protein